jgi:DNA-binding SARP family transcriptional activator
VRRRADVYLLDPQLVTCDVGGFSATLAEARLLLARGSAAEGMEALRRAQSLYAGDLLAEEGAAEWVVTTRQQLQVAATEAAVTLASMLLDEQQSGEAVAVCRWGLAVDRFHDPLWRLLLAALEAEDDFAGHARTSAAYEAMLTELGVQRPRG